MPQFLDDLIERHRTRGFLIDANLLLLLFLGRYDRRIIPRYPHTKQYTLEDYLILERFTACFPAVFTIPNILTEVSNLSGKLGFQMLKSFRSSFSEGIELLDERFIQSADASKDKHFPAIGLTDAAAIQLCAELKMLLLTDDLRLASMMDHRDIDVINFNHIREIAWK